jgi:hypothetical protein
MSMISGLENRSIRMPPELHVLIKEKAEEAGVPMYVFLQAAVKQFNPVENARHNSLMMAEWEELEAGLAPIRLEEKQARAKLRRESHR